MKRLVACVLALALLGLPAALGADYLTADGKLTEMLQVKDLQGGFAGFTGKQVTIQADGKWEEGTVFREKVTVVRSGQLTKEQLKKLAEELKTFDAATLKNAGKPMTNPHVITVVYGKNKAQLYLPAAGELPKPDAKEMPGRFAGVVTAVRVAVPAKKGGDS